MKNTNIAEHLISNFHNIASRQQVVDRVLIALVYLAIDGYKGPVKAIRETFEDEHSSWYVEGIIGVKDTGWRISKIVRKIFGLKRHRKSFLKVEYYQRCGDEIRFRLFQADSRRFSSFRLERFIDESAFCTYDGLPVFIEGMFKAFEHLESFFEGAAKTSALASADDRRYDLYQRRIEGALAVALRYGNSNETDRLRWLVDQMVRHLTGCPLKVEESRSFSDESDEYKAFVWRACEGEGEAQPYQWPRMGIAPKP